MFETGRFQAMGQLDSTCTAPRCAMSSAERPTRRVSAPACRAGSGRSLDVAVQVAFEKTNFENQENTS
jgi:hypothetical protein